MKTNKKILITGGAGFIGTALAKKLKIKGFDVSVIDLKDKITDYHKKNFKCFDVDIRDSKNFDKIKDEKFEIIYHLAAQTSGRISQEMPELDVDTNVKGTLNVCNFAIANKTKKIIFSSSMGVYGNKSGKIKETAKLEPLSNYGVSKICGEAFIKIFNQYNLEHTIFRFFNVYGPGQNMTNMKQGMASIFMAQSIVGNEIKVTGSLERYRDFVYIDDVIEALLLALDHGNGEIYNVGSGKKTTVKELIDLIIGCHEDKHNFKVTNIGAHNGDQFGTVADTSKIKQLGWKTTVNLSTGLKKMYNYGKEVL